MRIAFITAGAAGMYCGSCMRDNTLVAALNTAGHEATLIPTYTPIRTDEMDMSEGKIFFGGINIYLEQKLWLFRHTPRFVDWILNRPRLLRWVSRFAVNVDYADLGSLTVSMLKGEHGRQRKELGKLTDWLRTEVRPDVVLLTNALLSGMVHAIKQELGVPVLTTLQGDDIFLDVIPPNFRQQCLELIRENDRFTDAYICTSGYYADYMAGYLGIDRQKMNVVYPGISLKGHGGAKPPRENRPPTVGYFARICPEKGFHNLVDAFILLKQRMPTVRLKASGWLGQHNHPYFAKQVKKLESAGFLGDFEHVESPGHADKVRFLKSIDVLSVPTDYREPKGLYVLEAWANGVPVVQPANGSFPELIEAAGGGLTYAPTSPEKLAETLETVLKNPNEFDESAKKAQQIVQERFSAATMAGETLNLLARLVPAAVK